MHSGSATANHRVTVSERVWLGTDLSSDSRRTPRPSRLLTVHGPLF
jgi:hypothetical protein